MGRRDAVQTTLDVIRRMRELEPRLLVTYSDRWEYRGNGLAANYDFANVHHTGVPSSLARPLPTLSSLEKGRPDLTGPLCNEAGPACTVEAPRIHVVAAHPANHAGASRKSGPVPALSLFNPRTRGLEIDYAGSVPMLAGQLYVGHLWARANADVLAGGNLEHVRAHAETSVTGKWDPGFGPGKTIDMGAFRRAAAALLDPRAVPTTPSRRQAPDVSFVSIPPGEHITVPRPRGGQVIIDLGWDDNGLAWGGHLPEPERVGRQQVRVGVHKRGSGGSGWRAIAGGAADDPLRFWLGTQGTYGAELLPDDDLAVIRNMHPAWNLGVTISHLL